MVSCLSPSPYFSLTITLVQVDLATPKVFATSLTASFPCMSWDLVLRAEEPANAPSATDLLSA